MTPEQEGAALRGLGLEVGAGRWTLEMRRVLDTKSAFDVAFSPVGTWGIALSTSLVNLAGSAALFVLLRRKIGRVGFSDISTSFVRILAAATLAGATAFGVWTAIDSAAGRSLGGQLVSVLPAVAAAVAVYFGACFAFKVREMQALLSLRGRHRRA